uniref:Uncharacterized protein n=1 Tax=Mus musculus TaxID=10090 RepID=Q9D9H5_MOUSE|nr:unnamed protein product [Mus musculus]
MALSWPHSRWNFPSPAPGPSISAGDRLHQLSPDWQEVAERRTEDVSPMLDRSQVLPQGRPCASRRLMKPRITRLPTQHLLNENLEFINTGTCLENTRGANPELLHLLVA